MKASEERRTMSKKLLLTTVVLVSALLTVASHRVAAVGPFTQLDNLRYSDPAPVDNLCDLDEQGGEELREEFHQTHPLAPDGRVSVENLNGGVRIKVWDKSEVQVDAVKRAYKRERLNEARIEVNASADSIRVKTRYPAGNQTFTDEEPRRNNNPAVVEYTLTVPRKARIDSVELVNGAAEVEGVEGDVKASSINGQVTAHGLMGEARLSTVNGRLEAAFTHLDEGKVISLNSVNGSVLLIIPSGANAQLKASTVHGAITNDFGLPVQHGEYVGHELYGQLGKGGPRIKLGNVNGQITIKRAEDGHPLSSATNLLLQKDDSEPEVAEAVRMTGEEVRKIADEARLQALSQIDAARIAREAQAVSQREVEQALREAQREVERAQIEMQRDLQRQIREQARVGAEAAREARQQVRVKAEAARAAARADRAVERESKSFVVSGTPRVNIGTFDGSVIVRGWDKPEVMYTAIKRADNEQSLKKITVHADQQASAVTILAKSEDSGGSAHLDVYVPRNSNLHVSSDDGRLSVSGVSGEIILRTGDGSIEVADSKGQLQVNTGDGHIDVANFDGEVDARTGDGSISLDGEFTTLSARTGDGSISLLVPADSNFTVETNADAIRNDGLTISEDIAPSERVKRWKVGRGGNVFTLQTGDGRILLRPRGGPK